MSENNFVVQWEEFTPRWFVEGIDNVLSLKADYTDVYAGTIEYEPSTSPSFEKGKLYHEVGSQFICLLKSGPDYYSPSGSDVYHLPTESDNMWNVYTLITYTQEYVQKLADTLLYKGVISQEADVAETYQKGWMYKIGTAGTYAGHVCEPGDFLIANSDGIRTIPLNNFHWDAIQAGDKSVTSSTTTSTNNRVVAYDGTTGKIIKQTAVTIEGTNQNALSVGRTGNVGNASIAYGSSVTASGSSSFATGSGTQATGSYSHAEGNDTTATGQSSHAEGCLSTANGDCSHAEGYQTSTGNGDTPAGYSAHAEGNRSQAKGDASHAEGYLTIALGNNAHAEGNDTSASYANSHAEGFQTTASSNGAHAEGHSVVIEGQNTSQRTVASGWGSHAEGGGTLASGAFSHSENELTTASGNASHAEGQGTIANHLAQHTVGTYNIADTSSNDSSEKGNYVEIVGNGEESARSNARTLDWNGNERIMGDLYTGCNADSTGGTKLGDALALKAPLASPVFTGTPKSVTPTSSSNAKMIATKEYVDNAFTTFDAMLYKGVVNQNSDLPATHKRGWTYKVGTAGTYVGIVCEVGDMIVCNTGGTSANNSHWDVIQTNIDGAVIGPASSTTNHVALFNGATGKVIKDGGTIQSLVIDDNASGSGASSKVWSVQKSINELAKKVNETDLFAGIDIYDPNSASQGQFVFNANAYAHQIGTNYIVHNTDEGVYVVPPANLVDACLSYETLTLTEYIQRIADNTIDDTAGNGNTGKTWSADKIYDQLALKAPKASPVFTGSISLGRKSGSTVGTNSLAVGKDVIASGANSHAEGESLPGIGAVPTAYATASGQGSHAEGGGTTASGLYSHAEGERSSATAEASHAEGQSLATGILSHAEGASTASGLNAHAEGSNTEARGSFSHAENWGNFAIGDCSHAEGRGTHVKRYAQHTFGTYNVVDETGVDESAKGKYIEIVGNGEGVNTKSNARTLDWNGNERIMGDLYVGCNADSTGGSKVLSVSDFASSLEVSAIISEYGT